MGRETYLFCRERNREQRAWVSCWSPCRKSMADQGRHALGCLANPCGQPCSQTCYLDFCVGHPLHWKHGSLLLGTSPVPKWNATNSGKRNPTLLRGCSIRYRAIVTEIPLFHLVGDIPGCPHSLCSQHGNVAGCSCTFTASRKRSRTWSPSQSHFGNSNSHCVWKMSSSFIFSDRVNVLLKLVLQRRTCLLYRLFLL